MVELSFSWFSLCLVHREVGRISLWSRQPSDRRCELAQSWNRSGISRHHGQSTAWRSICFEYHPVLVLCVFALSEAKLVYCLLCVFHKDKILHVSHWPATWNILFWPFCPVGLIFRLHNVLVTGIEGAKGLMFLSKNRIFTFSLSVCTAAIVWYETIPCYIICL